VVPLVDVQVLDVVARWHGGGFGGGLGSTIAHAAIWTATAQVIRAVGWWGIPLAVVLWLVLARRRKGGQ
jgi:hypothetical protein